MASTQVKIQGMTCTSCEVLIERKWRKIPGVEKVRVNYATGIAEITHNKEISLDELQAAIKDSGYTVASADAEPRERPDYLAIGAIAIVLIGFYLIFKQLNLIPSSIGVSDSMTYGIAFVLGLVAAVSTCMAVTGGLVVAVSTKYSEQHPQMTGAQKFKPHVVFNLGRIISYTILGGAIGALGSFLVLSPQLTGIITVLVALTMILIGIQMLHLIPGLGRIRLKMPKIFAHKIYDASHTQKKATPFLLGAATFFLPCGFTQALQLYVLSTGNMIQGALIMLAFSLGTAPALISLGAVSSFSKGTTQKHLMRVAGVLVILLGLFSVNNGLALAGSPLNIAGFFAKDQSGKTLPQDPNVQLVDGKQIVTMSVNGLEYVPKEIKILQGIPVEWRIDGSRAQGCAQALIVPKKGIREYLPRDSIKVINFLPDELGTLDFSCTMGMARGRFIVTTH